MKNKSLTLIKITLLILLFFINSASYSQELLVEPYQIFFDYDQSSLQDDALSVSDAGGTPIAEAEWCHGDEISNPAYIKGQSNRKIKVLFDTQYYGIAHLIITLSYASGSSNGIGTICNLFVPNFDLGFGTADTLTIQFAENLPNYVGKHTFMWKWEIYAIPVGTTSYCAALNTTYTNHSFYTLLAEPKAPVAKPWTSVLDLACVWASNKITEAQVVADITTNAYNYFDQIKNYSGGGTHASGTTFNLSGFFNDNWGDCQDMSAVVQVFTWMLGGTVTRVRTINDKNPFIEDFYYKSIKPFGKSWTGVGWWNFHQVGWYNNVYDACIKVNYDNPRIPVNEDINGSYESDLHYSGDWVPKTPFYFTTVY
jgi:hypothetical protein